jgi:hypothetical protein
MTTALILNVVLATGALVVIISKIGWSIATQHRDRGHMLVSRRARRRRQLQPRPVRSHPAYHRGGQMWPAR